LKAPKKGWKLRPLTDQAKEALFNILGSRIQNCVFLDLFAGTGAVGIEALSRGAAIALFVEKKPMAVSLIRQNLELTGLSDRAEVYALDVLKALNLFERKGAKFDLVFVGAPYDDPILEKTLIKISETSILRSQALVVAEHRKQHSLAEAYGKLRLVREARYGETTLSFYEVKL
jgi:16S rRNA (guanine(966)-N(2))-methyltransferase RsmD